MLECVLCWSVCLLMFSSFPLDGCFVKACNFFFPVYECFLSWNVHVFVLFVFMHTFGLCSVFQQPLAVSFVCAYFFPFFHTDPLDSNCVHE